jgi:sec-independent protein translocase protein TatB
MFSEILVILLVAIIVLGPQKLPMAAKTLGRLWARVSRLIRDIREDILRP